MGRSSKTRGTGIIAQEINFGYMEMSALTGYNVHQVFYELAKELNDLL
ncbi:MAG: hypothetical protein R6U96_01930 [Promethearchaeia archaeon]